MLLLILCILLVCICSAIFNFQWLPFSLFHLLIYRLSGDLRILLVLWLHELLHFSLILYVNRATVILLIRLLLVLYFKSLRSLTNFFFVIVFSVLDACFICLFLVDFIWLIIQLLVLTLLRGLLSFFCFFLL